MCLGYLALRQLVGYMADSLLRLSYRTAQAAISRLQYYHSLHHILGTIHTLSSHHMSRLKTPQRAAQLLYLFSYGFEPLLSLFLTEITVPVVLWCQVYCTLRMGTNKGGLNGLIVIHLEETEPSPKCADGMQFRKGTFSYRVRDS
jgi:hypothetical protein